MNTFTTLVDVNEEGFDTEVNDGKREAEVMGGPSLPTWIESYVGMFGGLSVLGSRKM